MELPPWAAGSPDEFVRVHREVLDPSSPPLFTIFFHFFFHSLFLLFLPNHSLLLSFVACPSLPCFMFFFPSILVYRCVYSCPHPKVLDTDCIMLPTFFPNLHFFCLSSACISPICFLSFLSAPVDITGGLLVTLLTHNALLLFFCQKVFFCSLFSGFLRPMYAS